MAQYRKTRAGQRMNTNIMDRIIHVMATVEHDGLTQVILSKKIGIHPKTLRNYLTDEVWGDIKRLRLHAIEARITDLDHAILARAMEGDLGAAKLVYARWEKENTRREAKTADKDIPQDVHILTQEIEALRAEIESLEATQTEEKNDD